MPVYPPVITTFGGTVASVSQSGDVPAGVLPEIGVDAAMATLADPAAFVGAVSKLLIADADADRALAHLLELLIPRVADWGTIHLFTQDGDIRKLATRHRDPAKLEIVRELHALPAYDLRTLGDDELSQLKGRGGDLLDPIDDALLEHLAPNPRVRELWNQLGITAVAVVPFRSHGEAFGSMSLVMSDESRRFRPGDLELLQELADRSSVLVETARMVRLSTERLGGLALLDTLLAAAPLAMAVFDHDLCLMQANRTFLELGGESSKNSVGRPLHDVVPDIADGLSEALRSVLESGEPLTRHQLDEVSAEPESGRHFMVGAYPVSRPDGELLGIGCYLSDVTLERRTAAEVEESRARLDLSLAAGGLGTWDWDLRTGEVAWSGGLEKLFGLRPGAFGKSPAAYLDLVHPEDRPTSRRLFEEAAAAGTDLTLVHRMSRADGAVRWLEVRGRLATPTRMVGVAVDITERQVMEDIKVRLLEREHQARLESERVSSQLSFLDEAGTAMSSTLDPAEAFSTVALLVVPRVADACLVDAIDANGELHEMAVVTSAAVDAEDLKWLRMRRLETGGDGLWSVRRTIRTGKAELITHFPPSELERVAVDEKHLEVLHRINPRSVITVPLVARGRALGGFTVITTGTRQLDGDDLVLMQDLAARAALALDNARLFESRSRVARTLQQALLPPALPDISGMEVAARYRVAESGTEIGGDFYDLFEVGEGAWAVVVGDVCGKGTEAAALTGLFRHTVRAAAVRERLPSRVLALTNDAILDQIDDSRFCTAVLARLVASPAGALVTLACGGHPSPLVLRADGRVELVPAAGTLLGVIPNLSIPNVDVALRPGDSLVLFTDGVTEARRGTVQFGEGLLMEVLGEMAGHSADDVIDHLVDSLDEFSDGRTSDDTAVVVLRVKPPDVG
jgi:PAS domain S-box-containing protein